MNHNAVIISQTVWRRLPPALRAELRQVLGSKQAILNRPVLDVARALCARDASLLELAHQPRVRVGIGMVDLQFHFAEQLPLAVDLDDPSRPRLGDREQPRECRDSGRRCVPSR